MQAVITPGDGSIQLIEKPAPTLEKADDVIVKVAAAAVCGSDLFFVKAAFVPPTTTLGHEFIGVVHKVGEAVTTLTPGDRVLARMFVSCGRCRACRTGRQPHCPDYQLFGGGALSGGQAEYVRVPRAEYSLTKVPDALSDHDALVLTDIAPTAWAALERTGFTGGSSLTVVGAGPVGLLTAQLAMARGAGGVFVVELDDKRLARAAAIGAVAVDGRTAPADQIRDLTGGRGTDVAIDAVGSAAAITTAVAAVARGGAVGLVGILLEGTLPLRAADIMSRQIDVIPVLGNPYTSDGHLVDMVVSGRLSPGDVVDHEAPLSEAVATYAAFQAREVVKAVLRP